MARPDQPGHTDDYWQYFITRIPTAMRARRRILTCSMGARNMHRITSRTSLAPVRNKWSDLDGECRGNIDAFAFNFWDHTGNKRVNYAPPAARGVPMRDVQSGLRRWAQYRGYDAEVISQLADFNPTIPGGSGFTFAELKAEIDAGYPVLLMLQNPDELFRDLPGMPHANPEIHAMLAYGYFTTDDGQQIVRYRTSWASGDNMFSVWGPDIWQAGMTLRGVLGFHPSPKITRTEVVDGGLKVTWDGPGSTVRDITAGTSYPAHWYSLEKTDTLGGEFSAGRRAGLRSGNQQSHWPKALATRSSASK